MDNDEENDVDDEDRDGEDDIENDQSEDEKINEEWKIKTYRYYLFTYQIDKHFQKS